MAYLSRRVQPSAAGSVSSRTDEATLARFIFIGAGIGIVITFVLVAGLMVATDQATSTVIGVALMCSAFVGIGVGGMGGGIAALNRFEVRDRLADRAHRAE